MFTQIQRLTGIVLQKNPVGILGHVFEQIRHRHAIPVAQVERHLFNRRLARVFERHAASHEVNPAGKVVFLIGQRYNAFGVSIPEDKLVLSRQVVIDDQFAAASAETPRLIDGRQRFGSSLFAVLNNLSCQGTDNQIFVRRKAELLVVLPKRKHAVGRFVDIGEHIRSRSSLHRKRALFFDFPLPASGRSRVLDDQNSADDRALARKRIISRQRKRTVPGVHSHRPVARNISGVSRVCRRSGGKLHLERTIIQNSIPVVTVIVFPRVSVLLYQTALDVFHPVADSLAHNVSPAVDGDIAFQAGVRSEFKDRSGFHRHLHLRIGIMPIVFRKKHIVGIIHRAFTVDGVRSRQNNLAASDLETAPGVFAQIRNNAIKRPNGILPRIGNDSNRTLFRVPERALEGRLTALLVSKRRRLIARVRNDGFVGQRIDAEPVGTDIGVRRIPIHRVAVHIERRAAKTESKITGNLLYILNNNRRTARRQNIVGGIAVIAFEVNLSAPADRQKRIRVAGSFDVKIPFAVFTPFAHITFGVIRQLQVYFRALVDDVAGGIKHVALSVCRLDCKFSRVEFEVADAGIDRCIQNNRMRPVFAASRKNEIVRIAQAADSVLIMISVGVPILNVLTVRKAFPGMRPGSDTEEFNHFPANHNRARCRLFPGRRTDRAQCCRRYGAHVHGLVEFRHRIGSPLYRPASDRPIVAVISG